EDLQGVRIEARGEIERAVVVDAVPGAAFGGTGVFDDGHRRAQGRLETGRQVQFQDPEAVAEGRSPDIQFAAEQDPVAGRGGDATEIDVEAAQRVHQQVAGDRERAVWRPVVGTWCHAAAHVDIAIDGAGAG